MQIQLNTGKGIEHKTRLEHWLDDTLRDQLGRFVDDVARVEVHLSGESAGRAGDADKRCTIEARLVRTGSVAVHGDGVNTDQAIRSAIEKLKRAISSRVARDADHRDRNSIRTAGEPADDDGADSADAMESESDADAADGEPGSKG